MAERSGEVRSQFDACLRAGPAAASVSEARVSVLSIEPASIVTEPLTLPPVRGPYLNLRFVVVG